MGQWPQGVPVQNCRTEHMEVQKRARIYNGGNDVFFGVYYKFIRNYSFCELEILGFKNTITVNLEIVF